MNIALVDFLNTSLYLSFLSTAVVVGFDPTTYAVMEGPNVVATVGIVLSRASTEVITVDLLAEDGTAAGKIN